MNMLSFMLHEYVGHIEVAFVERIVNRLDVVETVRVHVASTLAQRVHNFGMI